MLFASTGDLLQLYNKPHNMSKRWLDKYLNLLDLFRCDRLLPGPPGARRPYPRWPVRLGRR